MHKLFQYAIIISPFSDPWSRVQNCSWVEFFFHTHDKKDNSVRRGAMPELILEFQSGEMSDNLMTSLSTSYYKTVEES